MDDIDIIKRFAGRYNGYGYGYGNGYGCDWSVDDGYDEGYGYGNGYGCGDGDGKGHGSGPGYSTSGGYGNGTGEGCLQDYCDVIREIDGHTVICCIDNSPIVIYSVHGNYAAGATINDDMSFTPCYIAKVQGYFALGDNLHDAQRDALAKYLKYQPKEVRIDEFKKQYLSLDTVVSNSDLFYAHSMLTGSCEFGLKQFCENHGIDLQGSMTVRQFANLTVNDYGGEIIIQLKKSYQ